MLTEELCDSKLPLSKLTEGLSLYPQHMVNLRVKDKDEALRDEGVKAALNSVQELIGGHGRALLRKSGTEPVIRIMIECESREKCAEYANIIADAVVSGGHTIE